MASASSAGLGAATMVPCGALNRGKAQYKRLW
jgi:hypothetical protein